MATIRPSVTLPDGSTYYPTGTQWLVMYALAGCQWAIDELLKIDPARIEPKSSGGTDILEK